MFILHYDVYFDSVCRTRSSCPIWKANSASTLMNYMLSEIELVPKIWVSVEPFTVSDQQNYGAGAIMGGVRHSERDGLLL